MTSLTNSNLELNNMFGLFMKMNTASSSGSRTLPCNTITNPKEDLKGITTRSGTAYQGPTIPTTSSLLPPVVECETEATKDMVHPTNNGSIEDIHPLVVPIESLILNSEPVISPIIEPVASSVSAPKPNQRPSVPYPSRLQDQKLCDKANDQREKFFQILKDLNFNISFADALILMPNASINLIPFSVWNKLSLLDLSPTCMTIELADHSISHPAGFAEDVFIKVGIFNILADFAVVDFDADPRVPLILGRSFLKTERALIYVFEEYSQEVLGFSDVIVSSNPTPYYDLIVSTTSPTLTPFGNSDFLLEEVDAFLALEDDLTSPKVDQSYVDTEGDILLLEAFLNFDPSLPLLNQGNYLPEVHKELKIYEAKSDKSSINEPPEVELKVLPPHLEYAFLEGDEKLPVIIAKHLSVEEKIALMTEDFEPAIQHQRRVNPKIHDVIKNEVLKLLDAGLIYPISDSPWVSPVHSVPRKGGFTVVENEENELILTHLVTGWRVCIDYRKLNEDTRKDHFPLPFMDQMLKRLAGNQYYWFLDGFSGKPLTFLRLATMDPLGDIMAQTTQPKRKVQLNELRDQAYENSLIYKEKTKRLYDSKIKDRIFNIGDRGTVELSQPDGPNFKVNGHRLKHYFRENVPKMVVPNLQTFPQGPLNSRNWVKLSDPKQALHGRHPVTPPNWVAAKYWVLGVLLYRSITQDIY
nr:reverse transcriptase domain-containing protein [Tanacetum cinerariifolium]